jgi:hypothetical protein
MTKIDVAPIEEMHRHLCAEIATLREVNALQVEQLRKAQDRIRAAEGRAQDLTLYADLGWDKVMTLDLRIEQLEAERDRAWNEAIEAAVKECEKQAVGWDDSKSGYGWGVVATVKKCAERIRSLAKEAGK